VCHVGQEDVALDDLFNRRAGLLEDGLEVGNAGGRLLLDGALDEVALGVAGDLSRAVDGVGRFDGLGLNERTLARIGRALVRKNKHRARQLCVSLAFKNVGSVDDVEERLDGINLRGAALVVKTGVADMVMVWEYGCVRGILLQTD